MPAERRASWPAQAHVRAVLSVGLPSAVQMAVNCRTRWSRVCSTVNGVDVAAAAWAWGCNAPSRAALLGHRIITTGGRPVRRSWRASRAPATPRGWGALAIGVTLGHPGAHPACAGHRGALYGLTEGAPFDIAAHLRITCSERLVLRPCTASTRSRWGRLAAPRAGGTAHRRVRRGVSAWRSCFWRARPRLCGIRRVRRPPGDPCAHRRWRVPAPLDALARVERASSWTCETACGLRGAYAFVTSRLFDALGRGRLCLPFAPVRAPRPGCSPARSEAAGRTPHARRRGSKAQIHTLPRPWSAAASIMWSHAMEASMSVETIPSKECFQGVLPASAHTTNA